MSKNEELIRISELSGIKLKNTNLSEAGGHACQACGGWGGFWECKNCGADRHGCVAEAKMFGTFVNQCWKCKKIFG